MLLALSISTRGPGTHGQTGPRDLIDVLDPLVVASHIVRAQTQELDPSSSKLFVSLGETAEFGGADGYGRS